MNYFILLLLIFTLNTFYCQNQQQFKNIIDPYFPKKLKYKIGIVLYQDFTVLDFVGPGDVFDGNYDIFDIVTIGEKSNSQVMSKHQTLSVLAKMSMDEAKQEEFDILMITGNDEMGSSTLNNLEFLENLKYLAQKAKVVFAVCTGSLTLAKTGLLDGIKATTNKKAYSTWTPKFPKVSWIHRARFVHNKKYITSSGVSAGTDAALYIISLVKGRTFAKSFADFIEYSSDINPDNDPFATLKLP